MIYLDNAATTKPKDEVIRAVNSTLWSFWGNSSSPHTLGRMSNEIVEGVRKQIADMINAEPEEIYFTSGGSEANSMAIKCVFYSNTWITTEIEHHSILNSTAEAGKTCYLKVDKEGRVDVDKILILLNSMAKTDGKTIVSVQFANNEIGTVQDIIGLGVALKRYPNVIFHTDAVQAFGYCCPDVKKLNIDMMSVSGHKIGAPQGIGFLYIRKGVEMKPLINGGEQNFGLRGGTDNVAYINGLGKACELLNQRHIDGKLKNTFVTFLKNEIPEIKVNGSSIWTFNNIISLTIPNINAAELIEYLSMKRIYISAGSACSTHSGEPSHVLKAIGLSDEEINSTVRISLSHETTMEEMLECAAAIIDFYKLVVDR